MQLRAGHTLDDLRPGGGERVETLVPLEHTDEERRRDGGQRLHRRREKRTRVDERRELGVRLGAGRRTAALVKPDSVRIPSTRGTTRAPMASLSGLSSLRAREP